MTQVVQWIVKYLSKRLLIVLTLSCFSSNDAGTDMYKRITAAKDFFFALANRTQAYELHHVISVISFNRQTEELMPFNESLEQFKVCNFILKIQYNYVRNNNYTTDSSRKSR